MPVNGLEKKLFKLESEQYIEYKYMIKLLKPNTNFSSIIISKSIKYYFKALEKVVLNNYYPIGLHRQ